MFVVDFYSIGEGGGDQLPMPKRDDIKSILVLGAGPIIIGQACEFDYSGTQACRALREEGYRVILVNSNPATIMTDTAIADATYIEPIRHETVAKIIERERPDALLPTMGGQTALNCALDLNRHGVLAQWNVKMIGASAAAITKAENREQFDKAMRRIGLSTPKSGVARSLKDAHHILKRVGLPCVIRPSFTMGGSGGGVAYHYEEFKTICTAGLNISPTSELLIDESLIGWKEYEMEVVRDKKDNCIIVCAIENVDPMGIHTGDSITVAPAQTLTDKEYQLMRNAAIQVLREIGVDTGGSNVQFAVNPDTGKLVVIEMNPRVSRSSALASKATGFPIAKVAAKLAIGMTLDELRNEITGGAIPASFEPTLDYVVTKIPRFAFEKFPNTNDRLTTQMKSVGEVMAIGRNFKESLQKALCGLEIDVAGFDSVIPKNALSKNKNKIKKELSHAGQDRLFYVAEAFRLGMTQEEVFNLCKIDRWFLNQIEELMKVECVVASSGLQDLSASTWRLLKRDGFSDVRLATLLGTSEEHVRETRIRMGIMPVYKRVDTCAAEFESTTAYMYSSYDEECEAKPSNKTKVIVIGGGPNRIGQGIEFDYCCVHAVLAMREKAYETIMINCNPETVSTDYDISDRLYFEPITLEHVLNVVALEQPMGVIVQYGGQTPLKLARALERAGVPILGTTPDAIDRAEDRERFQQMVKKLNLRQPNNGVARTELEAVKIANTIGYPLVMRPSYVLGGRAMEIVQSEDEMKSYMREAVHVSHESPVLLDQYLENAIEVDIDAICDGQQVVIGAIMQHIEQAGIHSGDSACALPPYSLNAEIQQRLRQHVCAMALELNVVGLMNVQMAVKEDDIYIIEVNPRASRTVPFVSKALGVSLARVAAHVMGGDTLAQQGYEKERVPRYHFVKEAVFPFNKFSEVDPILGPEMRSTGEVMGVGDSFAEAYAKSQLAINMDLPKKGNVLISVCDADKPKVIHLVRLLKRIGFHVLATSGTADVLEREKIVVQRVRKVKQGHPNLVDAIVNGEIQFVINTTENRQAIRDSYTIRRSALMHKVLYTTTIAGAEAIVQAIHFGEERCVRCSQTLHEQIKN